MMLQALCATLCLTLETGVGLQDDPQGYYSPANKYGEQIAVVDATIKYDVLYVQAKHIESLDTDFDDFTAIITGVDFDHGPWSFQFGIGYQHKEPIGQICPRGWLSTCRYTYENDMDEVFFTANVQFTFNGIFARREAVGGMDYSIVGLSTGWGY